MIFATGSTVLLCKIYPILFLLGLHHMMEIVILLFVIINIVLIRTINIIIIVILKAESRALLSSSI